MSELQDVAPSLAKSYHSTSLLTGRQAQRYNVDAAAFTKDWGGAL